MSLQFNKDEIKEALLLEDIEELVNELGGHPEIINDETLVSQTICHNHPGEGSKKLYYYDNTKLFNCYTDCDGSFDIFELVCKVKNLEDSEDKWELPRAVRFVASFFGMGGQNVEEDYQISIKDALSYIQKKIDKKETRAKQIVQLKHYDGNVLKYLPRPRITPWLVEGMTQAAIDRANISYDPVNHGIVIPHYDENGLLIGIRERTLIKEREKYGKYMPAVLNHKMFNHPLGFALYNLNLSKDNIRKFQTAIIFEGEKSAIKYASFFGFENDISVAACGSSISNYQISLLLSLGVKEIIIAFDKQYQKKCDAEHLRLAKKLENLHLRFGNLVQISYLFDLENALNYKDSPVDQGKEIFFELYKNRIQIKEDKKLICNIS